MRTLWRLLLIRLGVLKLYAIDYGGETDWVSGRSSQEAYDWWRDFQASTAGDAWLEEVEADGIDVVRERDLAKVIGGDAPPGLTFRKAMAEFPAPCFIATSVY